MNKKLLVTSNIKSIFGNNQNIYLINEIDSVFHIKNELPKDIFVFKLEDRWKNRALAIKDYKYLSNLYKQILPKISNSLNILHNVDYSNRSWEFVIGFWLHQFLAVSFDRYHQIQEGIKKWGKLDTYVISFKGIDLTPLSFTQASAYMDDLAWNHYFYSKLFYYFKEINIIKFNNNETFLPKDYWNQYKKIIEKNNFFNFKKKKKLY